MYKQSIKLKITLLNTVFMILIVILLLGYMTLISNKLVDENIKYQLKEVINTNKEYIYYKDSLLHLDDVDFYNKEVYTYVYSNNGLLIQSYQSNLPTIDVILQDQSLSTITINDIEYYMYDLYIENINGEPIWIRGITLSNDETQVISDAIHLLFITLPIIVLIAGIGCFIISKKALEPINKIIKTANDIKNSNNLSLRINLKDKTDEIHTLANTFDSMFDSIEKAFDIEKDFTRDASHELRTPITVILAQTSYAKDNKLTKEETTNMVKVIDNEANKMNTLTNNLLNLARLDKGIYTLNKENTNLSELLEIICEEYSLNKTNNITLTKNIDENIYVDIDKDLFIRCITNLINNAYKYRKKDGTIKLTLTNIDNQIIIKIKDNGIGIKKENIDKVFNRFFQEEPSRNNNDISMGLGLSFVQEIIKLHDASIDIKSVKNKETTFTIKL